MRERGKACRHTHVHIDIASIVLPADESLLLADVIGAEGRRIEPSVGQCRLIDAVGVSNDRCRSEKRCCRRIRHVRIVVEAFHNG